MLRSIAFITVLLISPVYSAMACLFYPEGEDVRFWLLDPDQLGYRSFTGFHYSCSNFGWHRTEEENDAILTESDENIRQWMHYCKGEVPEAAVFDAVYKMDFFSLTDTSVHNAFTAWLQRHQDTVALQYLSFAKQVETSNGFASDPWERQEHYSSKVQQQHLKAALDKAARACNPEIRARYAFLALRISFYNGDFPQLRKTYAQYFSVHAAITTIDYWALHFRAMAEPDHALQNFYVSQVFAWAADKRIAIHGQYNREVPVEAVLRYARSDKERGAVWLMRGVKNPGRAMDAIRQVYRYIPESDCAAFLLLREINKLEDWIYTPVYSLFTPSLYPDNEWSATIRSSLANVERDRAYAATLRSYVQQLKVRNAGHQRTVQLANAYLLGITRDPRAELSLLARLARRNRQDTAFYTQVQRLRATASLAVQQQGRTVIPQEFEQLLISEHDKRQFKFIFAMSRELEQKGNKTDAALLLSRINETDQWDDNFEDWRQFTYWRDRRHVRKNEYDDTYIDALLYMDVAYTLPEIKHVLDLAAGDHRTDAFSVWKYAGIRRLLPRYRDLLATRYMRQNRLGEAYDVLKLIPDTLWSSIHYSYKDYLDANPFFINIFAASSPNAADTVHYTKPELVRQLMTFIRQGEDAGNRDRDRSYFQAANCFLNMSQYGNSWMMKRYYWSAIVTAHLDDDEDYYRCRTAKQYYLKAMSVSKDRRFKALCLRMAGRCEMYALQFDHEKWSNEAVFRANPYYRQLKRSYPQDYEPLVSYCDFYEQYYLAR